MSDSEHALLIQNSSSLSALELLRQEVFELIYTSNDIDTGIHRAIAKIGKLFQVDRVYIFENNDDNTHSSNTFEWCGEGIVPQIQSLQNMSFEDFDYQSLYDEQGLCFCPDVSLLSEPLKSLFEGQDIRAVLQYAMFDRGVFRGFVGFDDCHRSREDWRDDGQSLSTLIYFSRLLSLYLLKERNLLRANEYHERLEKSLEKERALRKKALLATEAKNRFLSNISHDMRTPLNGILGFTHLALESQSVDEKNDCLDRIAASGKFLLDLINETLELSKIETGKISLHPEVVSSRSLLNGIMANIHPAAQAKNISIILDDTKTCGSNIYADILRIQEIFSNLLSNAVKFTPEDGVIQFRAECLSQEHGVIHEKFVIRDNGIGMSAEFLDQAFEPFSQENPVESQNFDGTGLGLSIVKQLVELMGGRIELCSQLKVGTEFTIYIDFPVAPDDTVASKVQDWPDFSLHNKHILVCEDHPINSKLVKRLLEKNGAAVTIAANGKLGVEQFSRCASGTFDAVLMDIRMPVMDGLEACRAIRALDMPDARTIPIIAMTANVFEDDRQCSKAAGMTAHLAKPVEPRLLFQTLAEACRNRK